jgi:hypothetical protein
MSTLLNLLFVLYLPFLGPVPDQRAGFHDFSCDFGQAASIYWQVPTRTVIDVWWQTQDREGTIHLHPPHEPVFIRETFGNHFLLGDRWQVLRVEWKASAPVQVFKTECRSYR